MKLKKSGYPDKKPLFFDVSRLNNKTFITRDANLKKQISQRIIH